MFRFILCGIMIVSLGIVYADDPVPGTARLPANAAADAADSGEATQAEVQRLLEELDAPQLARRNAAEQSLIELGEPATQFLPPIEKKQPPEVAQRLRRIREQITRRATTAVVDRNVSTDVRLGDASTLGAALEAISRDSGIEFDHEASDEIPITPFAGPLPFWHAVDHVLDQAKLDVDFYSGDSKTLALVPRKPARTSRTDSAAYAGLFRLEPLIVTSRRILRDASLSGMSVEIELSWKPDSHPVGITLPLADIRAQLDDGATITAQRPEGTIDVAPSDEIAMTNLQLPLQLPAGRPTTIKSLSGKIQSMLPGEVKPFEFLLKAGQQAKTTDSVTVRLEEVRKNATLHEVRLGVEFAQTPGKAMESHRGWLLGNEVYVERADGTREDHLGYELYRHNDKGIGIGYMFDVGDTPGDAKLIYKTPTDIVQTELDFVIHDIAMP
jgi:hypothetical protein